MLIVVAIVIALTRHSMKEGVYLIKRWPRWQTDADVQNCSIMMKMSVEMIGMVLAVMVIKNKTNLASSWGKDGEEKARHTSDYDSCFDFKRISLLFTLYFIALDFPYLLKHISHNGHETNLSEGAFSKS